MPAATVPLSTVFCADDADVVIRAEGALDLHAHKCILSLASPILKSMFADPQTPSDPLDTLPRIDVEGSPETWENILRTIYPISNPTVDNLADLGSLLSAAQKYEMQYIVDIHKRGLENPVFIREDPLRLYAIACACGLEDQAKYVARNAELLTITRHPDLDGLHVLMTFGSYHRLISFLAERDNELHQALGGVWISLDSNCDCNTRLKEDLYNKIKENLKRPYLQAEEVYLKALEDRSRYSQPACTSPMKCSFVDSEIKAFIERVIQEREKMCDELMFEKRYVKRHPTALYPKLSSSILLFPGSYVPGDRRKSWSLATSVSKPGHFLECFRPDEICMTRF